MTKILIARDIPDEGLKMLRRRKSLKVSVYEKDRPIPRRELMRRMKGVHVLVSILTDRIDGKVMDASGGSLKMIANYAVGFNNVDLAAAKERGIVVTNAPGKLISESVAEHAVALIFGLSHRIVETDAFTRAGKYKAWGPKLLLGTDVAGKTLGIVGTGRIGEALARRMYDGFGVKIVYSDLKRNARLDKKYKAKYRTLGKLLKESDFVSLHVPLLESTQHLIGAKELKMMKKTAFLINTARGPVVDELALVKALTHGEIGGAGLDVYECEPLIDCKAGDAYDLRVLNNVILTPHTASATVETRQEMSRIVAKNVLAFLDGKRVPNRVR